MKRFKKIIEKSRRTLPDSITIRFNGPEEKKVLKQITDIAKKYEVSRNKFIVNLLKENLKGEK